MSKKKMVFLKVLAVCFFFSSITVEARRIAILIRPNFLGEVEFANRIVKASKNIGWESIIEDYQDKTLDSKHYDFMICLVPEARRFSTPAYLALFDPKNHYFRSNGLLKTEYLTYSGYLVTYPIDLTKKVFSFFRYRPWMNWLPLVQFSEYKEVDPDFLFYVCCAWGNRARDERYKTFLSLLDQTSYARFYGGSHFSSVYPDSYLGSIPMDGESMLLKIHENGVCLVLHSSDHLGNAIPSGRIFEAVAASSVVISDQNPFVLENFGNSVLYIDHTSSGVNLFNQVEAHMNWIRSHKKEARAMAKKAYEIYRKKFLLEDQLIRLGELYDQK